MKSCYVIGIGLERFSARFKSLQNELESKVIDNYEIIGVDGYDLVKSSNLYSESALRPGQLGCALSHVQAYDIIVKKKLPYALIVEDDVVIPSNIELLLNKVVQHLPECGVISFYNPQFKPVRYSIHTTFTNDSSLLLAPVDTFHLVSNTAYLISYEAARGIAAINRRGRFIADHWWSFYEEGGVKEVLSYSPTPFRVGYLPSTIGYKSRFFFLSKIPFLNIVAENLKKYLFSRKENKYLNNFLIVKEMSFIERRSTLIPS